MGGPGYDLAESFELLSDDFADQMLSAELDPVQRLRASVSLCPPPTLALEDYPHIEPSLRVALPYLRHALETRGKGVNLFIYGTPGTGKTQLSRVLAKALGCDLFQVSSENEDGDPTDGEHRLRSFRAAQSMLAQRRVIVAFDEAADAFEDGDQYFGRRSTAQTRKAWVNRTHEENQIPTLWLSNSINCLDPACVRRFDMVIELGIRTVSKKMFISGRCQVRSSAQTSHNHRHTNFMTQAFIVNREVQHVCFGGYSSTQGVHGQLALLGLKASLAMICSAASRARSAPLATAVTNMEQ